MEITVKKSVWVCNNCLQEVEDDCLPMGWYEFGYKFTTEPCGRLTDWMVFGHLCKHCEMQRPKQKRLQN